MIHERSSVLRFVSALLDAEPMVLAHFSKRCPGPRALRVHRHTTRIGLTDTLRTAYPAVVNAVGDTYFDALAAEFIRDNPPRSPVMQEYSPAFPDFLEGFPPLSAWPWLGDVARIDWARREAYHATDAVALTARQLQTWPIETLMSSMPRLHPSLRIIESPHPAWSLWCRQQPGANPPREEGWYAESVQIWRVDLDVKQRQLTQGEAAVRQQTGRWLVIWRRPAQNGNKGPHFDAASAITSLIVDGLIVALEH
ncbi:MAG: putative DNA-binding domain-containing protein [Ahniella sp.]|nr:putative DNA-binding domain-containing protein [Ahniella sp.]